MPPAQTHEAPGPRALTAGDLMTPSPRTCSPFSTVTEVSLLFRDADCGAVPVVEEGKPVGIITDRDVALAASEYADLVSRPIGDLMTRDVVTVRDDATIEEVTARFASAKVRRLVVVDAEGRILGMLSWSDLAARLPEGDVGRVVSRVIDPPVADTSDDRDAGASSLGRVPPSPPERASWTDPKALWGLVKEAGVEWAEDKAPRLGAALAYYTIFSLAPLLLIAIAVAGLAFGREAAQGQIVAQLRNMIGVQGAEAVQAMIASASKPGSGFTATGVGLVLLLFGAMGLFGQLQDAMNTVWEVQPKPGRGLMGMLKDRLMSLSMVMGTVFLLLVSLVASAAMAAMTGLLGSWATGAVGQVVDFAVSFAVITGLFAMIYRFLPDAQVAWGDVWLGAAITSLLFGIGKTLIGLYIGRSSVASAYGAAGSLVVLLVWAYYSAQIFLYGAELTKVFANRFGSGVHPEEGAEPVTAEARANQGIPRRAPGAASGSSL